MSRNFERYGMNLHFGSTVNFPHIYETIRQHGDTEVCRNGAIIHSMHNVTIDIEPDCLPLCQGRNLSLSYLEKEFEFYKSGSNLLEDALNCSKFWSKCSDDGKTINSNYGKLLLHDKNSKGFSQFEHAYNCLMNNIQSKKAVMTVYNNENAYISNDNPCTMFVAFFVQDSMLNMQVVMRSNDLFYGLPYDLPWYRAVQIAMLKCLHANREYEYIRLGHYLHTAVNLHYYERNEDAIHANSVKPNSDDDIIKMSYYLDKQAKEIAKIAIPSYDNSSKVYMAQAWNESKKSRCLKKHCGAVLVYRDIIVGRGYGDRNADHEGCTHCARDTGEKFYSDGCYSVHAEMRAIHEAMQKGFTKFTEATMFVTHGPCDACCKLMDFVGIKTCVYDEKYKTKYKEHWPNMNVYSLEEYNSLK